MAWWMWLAGGLVLLVIELVTPSGFFVLFFGLGALTVGAIAGLGLADSAVAQWLIFTIASLTSLLLFRSRLQQRVRSGTTDVDTLIGEIAIPRERIRPGELGRVDLRGTMWTGRNEAEGVIEPDQRCRVVGVDGLIVGVRPE
ncbi:MAG TPA: NfeD family protein [Vicinamibacterales bacterium]|nr:NfeD family protein [Vicinamibacterales bacterium]